MKHFLLVAFTFFTMHAFAQSDKLKATSINIFKNGTYFVVKEGDVNVRDGQWSFAAPLTPLLSTLWFTTVKDVKLNRVDFSTDTIRTSRQARSWADIAKTAKGKRVRVLYKVSEQLTHEIKGVLLDFFPESGITKIKSDDGSIVFLFSGNVLEFQVEGTTESKFKADSLGRVASLHFSKENGSTPLKLSYMSMGMMWQPSYNIKLIDEKTLQLEMKALVENYSEPVDNADLTITVGAPQFRYGMQIDPAALVGYSGYTPSYETNTGVNNYQYRNMPSVAGNIDMSASRAYSEEAAPVQPQYNNYQQYTTTGEKSNDLYKYRIGKVSLEKNAKSSFSVFSANIPYDDIYECNVNDYIVLYSTRYINNNPENHFPVYHSLKLNNNTTYPFTTAPVFVLDEKLEPLAQDILNYTPTGGKTKVQLSQAPDVYVTNTEEEQKKETNAKTINKVSYSLVTVKGTIPVENLQPKAITLNLTKYIYGNLTEASDGGTIKKPGKYAGMNAQSSVEWNIKVGANEKKNVTYVYEVYVPNY